MVFTTGLRNVITVCPRPKSASHKLCILTESACIMNMKSFNSSLGIIICHLVEMPNV